MKLKTYLRRAASWGLCLLICISGTTRTALAAEAVEPMKKLPEKCSLTLEFPCTGLPVELYQVAGVNESVRFSPIGEFKSILETKLKQDLNESRTAGDWKDLAATLNGELAPNNVKPDREGTVQAVEGKKVVRFGDLAPGLYLIKPKQTYKSGLYTYTTTPYLVCLPNWMQLAKDGPYVWVEDVQADFTKKVEAEYKPDKPGPIDPGGPGGADPTSRRVAKVWLDSEGKQLSEHPDSVRVELWRDGSLYDTVTLNQSNGWSCSWIMLDAEYEWTVREVADGSYRVSVSSDDGVNYLITNTRPDDPDKPPEDPDHPPEEPPTEIDEPDVPLGPPPSLEDPKDPSDPYEIIEIDDTDVPLADLPQTGQLWWPVPVLAVGGVFLFLMGWVKHRGAQDEE